MFNNEKQRFSLRKLSVGLASVCIGITFISVKQDTVKADTIDAKTNIVTAQSVNPDVQKADTQKELLKNTDTQDGVKQTEPIDKTSDSNTPRDLGTNGVAKENIAVSEQLENKENIGNNVKDVNNTKQNELHVSTGDNQLNSTHENKQALETSLLKDTTKPETTNTFHVRKSNIQANINALRESKAVDPNTNGGFDEATWGKLDVNDWKGSVQGDYYQLNDYTGDANHVIVPNEADFAKAGISTFGKQVGVTSDVMHTIFRDKTTAQDATVAFSKTDNKQVKAIGNDWSNTWNAYDTNRGAKLSKFDGTNLDVSNATDMSSMFESNQISNLSPLANWNVNNVTSMNRMFYVNHINDLSPLANWNVNNVTDMAAMFASNQISDLNPLASWKVDKVTNMNNMFATNQISDLSPLASWKVDNVTNMGFMFEANRISDLSPLASWKTDNVTNMRYMFHVNSSIQTKNLQAKRVINFVYPAGYTGKKQDPVTQTVDVPQRVKVELTTKDSKPSNNILDWVTKKETPISTLTDPVYFQDYTVPEIKGLLEPNKTVIAREQADITKPINVTVTYKLVDSNTNDAFALDSKNGLHEHANVNDNGGYDEDYWGKISVDDWNYTVNGDIIRISSLKDSALTGVNDAVIVPNLADFKLAGKDGGAKAVYISKDALSKTAKHKYYGLSKTNDNTFVTDSNLNSAFRNDSNLTHADLNSLNTNNVTNMSDMFSGTSSLTSLDVSNWDTSKVTDMSSIFKFNDNGASSLTSLDVSNWDTSNVTNMNGMFNNASSLKSLDVSKWNTSKVTDMSYMFSNASKLTSLDVSKWNTGNVTDMHNMFEDTYSLTSLDVSKWNTGNVTDMSYMFEDPHSLTSLDVSNWDTSNVTNMNGMFDDASSLTSLDVSNWDTSNVTNMNGMFDDADNLTDLDVSHWDTGKVTDMSQMFSDVSRLTSLDVSNWDTGKVTDMSWMFYGASSLKSLDVSKWDTGNVTNMINMFRSASSLTSLDVSKWDTRNVTYMNLMFNNASSLTGLDVSKWNTGKVTYMNGMFADASSLTSLDVSKWDTSNVTYMIEMFSNDPNLALIVNSGKFADYLVNHDSFAMSTVDSDVKSVTTDNTKLLKLLTSDVGESKSATRTIVFTFPTGYSPDLNKYHLTKNGNTYQIKQSADYDKSYVQGTVLINATYDIAYHHIDTTKPYKLSWQPNYDKLVLAHKNADGSVSFDAIQLPKVPGYKTIVKTVANPVNPARALFAVSFMALPKQVPPVQNDVKPVKTVTLATPVAIEMVKPIKTEPKVATTLKVIDLSDDAVSTTPKEATWQVANNLEHDTYYVSNGQYAVKLPHISNAQLYVIANDSTKDSVLFTYKGQNTKYVFNIKFVNGHYLLTTYKIKSGKLVKLIDYNFIKSSKMIDVIIDWIKLK